MEKKKVKIKVKKKRIKVKNIIITLLILLLLGFTSYDIITMPIKNINIINNDIVSDKEILESLNIIDYPSFVKTIFSIKKNKIYNPYIKNFTVKKKLINKLYIEIEEYKPIAIYKDKVVLNNNSLADNIYNLDYLPYLINDIDSIYDSFVKNFNKIDNSILYRISQIEYKPNDIDEERFLLYMIDGNYVYISLSKIEKINKKQKKFQIYDRSKSGASFFKYKDYMKKEERKAKTTDIHEWTCYTNSTS